MGKGKLFGFVKGWKSKRSKTTDTDSHALDILPAEIWTIILDNVDRFEDRWNCYNTCSTWRNILEPGYTWGIYKILPGVMKYLDLESILNCRLVSKKWCDSVDNLVDNNAKLRPYDRNLQKDTVSPLLHASHFSSPLWSFTSGDKIELRIQALEGFPEERCPIVGRYLKMHYLTDQDAEEIIEEHYDLACELISIMGRHVYYFDFIYDPSQFDTPIQLYNLIAHQLDHLPNLRMFKLNHRDADPINWTFGDYDALRLYILREDPLPHIPTLESLILPLSLPTNVLLLMQYRILWIHSAQLKNLEIPLSRLTPLFFQRLTSLTELTVTIDSTADVHSLLLCVAPLQKLTIVMGFATKLFAECLLEVTAHFSHLNHLYLSFGANCYVEDSYWRDFRRWDCSSVKRLSIDFASEGGKLDCSDYRISLNFLTAFTSVEHIHVINRVMCPHLTNLSFALDTQLCHHAELKQRKMAEPLVDIVQLRAFMHSGHMYRSNIWDWLPNLSFIYKWLDHPVGSVEHFHCRQVLEGMRKLLRKKKLGRKKKLRHRVGSALGKGFIQVMSMFI